MAGNNSGVGVRATRQSFQRDNAAQPSAVAALEARVATLEQEVAALKQALGIAQT